jgi:hypothetical protein
MTFRRVVAAAMLGLLLGPRPAAAQTTDAWEVNFAPLYVWASEISGEVSVNRATAPVFMSFADAVDNLSGIFTFHLDARKGRWGFLTDVGFVRLSTQSQATIPGLLPTAPNRLVTTDLELGNTIFEGGASYLVSRARDFSIIGGLRTYTMSPGMTFTGAASQVAPVDGSQTAANAFVGFMFRPRLSEKWTLVSRADIGGGSGFTWSGTAALQFQMTRHAGLMFGYRGLGVDTGEVGSASTLPPGSGEPAINFHRTHYGPIVAMNLRWGVK